MIMRDDDIKREADGDKLRLVMLGMVDEMISDCVAGIDGDRICPVCGSLVSNGQCQDVGDSGCRWTTSGAS